MKKPKAVLAEGIATGLFTVTAFKRCREWRRCAVDRVLAEEQELNIEMGGDRFRERVDEVMMGFAQAEADRIEEAWYRRLGVVGSS